MGRNLKDEYYENCIEQFKPLIQKVMRELKVRPVDREDCIQLGTIAIWKAVERYDPERFELDEETGEDGFTGYVHNAIKYEMLNFLSKEYKHRESEIPLSCMNNNEWLNNLLNGEVKHSDYLF